jgi:ATP-binding cassette subfamily B protein
VTLSHGQRQRIAIARAAIRKAPILILDEPMTGLDRKNQRAVTESLERLNQGRTTFLITHDLHHATDCDLILYLEGGQLLERGTHETLMQANGRYAALYRLQANTRSGTLPSEETHAIAG